MTQAEIGQPVPRIDVEALIARLCDPRTELALLDVREEGQFGMGHMLWAVNAPYSRLEAVVPSLVPRHASMIVLVDAGDNVAQRAASRLRSLGYLQVFALDGGIHAWEAAGHPVFQGVYVPGKVLGEWAEEHLETPSIDAVTLDRLQAEGAPLVVLDPRSEAEHAARHIPGALSCPNGEILLRFEALAPSYDTLIVVACGGRTRGIVGAQTLIDAGVGHRVVALADGNHGWQLAGLNLETGLRHKAPAPDFAQEEKARKRSLGIAQAQDVPAIDAAQLARWRTEDHRTTYVLDVRTPAEFAQGHLEGAHNAPGGQLVQASDRWLGTLHARVVLVDDDGVRAIQSALWLRRLGWDAYALALHGSRAPRAEPVARAGKEGVSADQAARIDPPWSDVLRLAPELDVDQARARIGQGGSAWCVGSSEAYLLAHPPGAAWATRARLDGPIAAAASGQDVILFSEDDRLAHLAAADLLDSVQHASVFVVRGGQASWEAAGEPVEAPPADALTREQRIDFLFWAHDRRSGNAASMRAYLDWEKQLTAQAQREPAGFPLARVHRSLESTQPQ
ncbi:rhodanese-like domain-containing protein [Cupriavidus basilensis]|uniref:rhodanese-like domain-containing protein n=1 Tax=Cupriavidus basilensis TaxID=68895 RepID=UPI0007513597|nr:rhodanese-like domain-containing protein [Cupriavidus basilensis]